jgi:hypothetical protein
MDPGPQHRSTKSSLVRKRTLSEGSKRTNFAIGNNPPKNVINLHSAYGRTPEYKIKFGPQTAIFLMVINNYFLNWQQSAKKK